MILQTYFPQKLSPARYDAYLASGWFRGSVMLYKLDLLCVENDLYSVVNIRLDLENYSPKKRFRKLIRQNDERFRVEIGPARIDKQRDDLYQNQKAKFKGFIHNNLHDYLNAGFQHTVFDTREVAVYDGDQLVAVSFYDRGQQSVASLLGLYRPEYSEHSLGMYTMLKELEESRLEGKRWYYPGYVLDKQSSFNYKLRLGEYEFYNQNKRWCRFDKFSPDQTLAWKLKQKHDVLRDALEQADVPYESRLYPFFSMGYMNFWGENFVRSPLVAFPTSQQKGDHMVLLAYDLETDKYRIMLCRKAPEYEMLINMEMSSEFSDPQRYLSDLLILEQDLYSSESAHVIAAKTRLIV